MKIELGKLINSSEALMTLFKLGEEGKLPTKLTYRLSKILKKINPEIDAYEETRKSLIVKLGTKDDKGNPVIKAEDTNAMAKYNKELETIIKDEVAVDISFIPEDLLLEVDNLPTSIFIDLDWLIEESE